jgi:pyrophosphatase PpaX
LAYNAVIFDMDGVLVDAAMSYVAAAVDTVAGYSPLVLDGLTPEVDAHWVTTLKNAGGFNNDWDLSSALLRGLSTWGQSFDVDQYGAELKALGGGLQAVDLLLGKLNREGEAILGPARDLKRFFQEFYLGEELFFSDYGASRTHYKGQGYIEREAAILSDSFFVARQEKLGIATGRPRMEAQYTLERMGRESLFAALVTHDCACEAGQPGKPDPWLLLEAARRLGVPPRECVYVGDQPDDMRAAGAAGMTAIGFVGSHDAELLLETGAITVVADEEALAAAL